MSSDTVNPVIPGFAPDPSVVLIDDTFFLVNSTFHVFPGLPIYASKDLVNWKHIGNAINRQSQLSLRQSITRFSPLETGEVMLSTGGLYAPTIRYHNGTVFVVCTNVVHSETSSVDATQNFIVSTQDIWSDQWSDPVYFDFRGIDPSIFFDDDGRSYIQGSAAPGPMTKIHLFEIDLQTGDKLSEERKIWDGTGGIYPEGPHIYKKDGQYYLMISEGGTHDGHMITCARARDIWGPYESYKNNPILTAKGSDEYIQYTGHCDFFHDQRGYWWGVCLGVRKDKKNRFVMGRETFLTPGTWRQGEWPTLELVKLNPGGLTRDSRVAIPPFKPEVDYLYIRDADLSRYKFSNQGSLITLTPSSYDLSQPVESPTFVGKRQRSLVGSSTATILSPISTRGGHIQAGLACYKDEHRYVKIFYDSIDPSVVLEIRNNAKKIHSVAKSKGVLPVLVDLRIEYTEDKYVCSYKDHDDVLNEWHVVGTVDTLDLTGPDFVGPIIGVFSMSDGETADIQFSDMRVD